MPYKKIILALAGDADEGSVIQEAIRLSASLGAELAVLHVNDASSGKISMMMDSEPLVTEEDVRRLFQEFGFAEKADAVSVEIRTSGSVAKEIARATKGADLLVIGHRQKNRFLAALADTADKHLADLVSCPVLIVPRMPE